MKDRQGVIDVSHGNPQLQPVAQYRAALDKTRPGAPVRRQLDPLLAQCFSVTARCGCYMQAARRLNLKATRLRQQLAQLERQLQCSLFSPSENGLVLSREGLQLHKQLTALAHDATAGDRATPGAAGRRRDHPARHPRSRPGGVAATQCQCTPGHHQPRQRICPAGSQRRCRGVAGGAPIRRCRDRVSPSASRDAWRDSTTCRTSPTLFTGRRPAGRPR